MNLDEMNLFTIEEPEAVIQHRDFWYLAGKSGFVVWNRETKKMDHPIPYERIVVSIEPPDVLGSTLCRSLVIRIVEDLNLVLYRIEEGEHDDIDKFLYAIAKNHGESRKF